MTSKSRDLSDILGDNKNPKDLKDPKNPKESKDSTDLKPTVSEEDREAKKDRELKENTYAREESEVREGTGIKKETPVVVKGNVKVEGDNEIREDRVEDFDTRGNEITDNYPLDWEKAPAGTVIASGAVPSDNAVVVNELPRSVYAGENEYDDKGFKDDEDTEQPPETEEPPVDPPIEETEPPARETHKVPFTESPRSDASRDVESESNKGTDLKSSELKSNK